jgi:capsid protein
MFKDNNGDQNVIQYYNKFMSRQLRGYPLAYKIIAAAKNYDRFMDATLARAVMESIMMGVTSNTESSIGSQIDAMAETVRDEDGYRPASGLQTSATASQLNPGNIFQLQGKGELKFTDLKTPSNNFDKLQNAYIDIVGMATDTPPEVVLSK